MKKSSKKQKNKNYVKIVSLFAILMLVFFVYNIFFMPSLKSSEAVLNHTVIYDDNLFFTYEINKYPSYVEISNISDRNLSIGFSLESSSLNFGVVPTGGNMGKRFLTLTNMQNDTAKMLFRTYGNISDMIKFNDNDFYLEIDVVKPIEIILETNENTPVGYYSGEINLVVKRAKYDFIKWFL